MYAAFHFPVMSDVLTIGQAETCKKARAGYERLIATTHCG